MIHAKSAIRGEHPGKRREWEKLIFLCSSCGKNEITVFNYPSHLKRATGLCRSCSGAKSSQTKRPFEGVYNRLTRMARYSGKKVDLTYKQFLQFTEVNSCHYCSKPVDWKPHGDTGYNLDRKNNSLGYSVENCVVCCGDCNKLKGDRFTYEEMLLLSPALKEIFIRKHKVSVLNKC